MPLPLARALAAALLVATLAACSEDPEPGTLAPGAQVPTLAYPSGELVLQVGVALAPQTPAVGGAVTDFSVTPPLPAGLSLDPASGVLSGIPEAAAPPASFTVTATGPDGSSTFDLVLDVRDAFTAPRAAIALTFQPPTLVHWRVDALTGRLVPGTAVPTLPQPFQSAVHPSGEWLVVVHLSGFIAIHALDPVTGAPTPAFVVSLGSGLVDAAFDPTGRSLYVASLTGGSLSHFTFDAATGALGLGAGDLLAPGITDLVVSADGTRLFASGASTNLVGVIDLDPATGAFAGLAHLEFTDQPYRLALDPSGAWLFAVSFGADALRRFAVDPGSGALKASGDVPVAAQPIDAAFDAAGTNLRVVSFQAERLSTFSFDALTGATTLTSTLPLGGRPTTLERVEASPTSYLVPLFDEGGLARVGPSAVPGSTALLFAELVASGPIPVDVAVVRAADGATLIPGHFHVAEQLAGTVSSFELVGLALTLTGPPVFAGDSPSAVAIDASGTQLAVASQFSSEVRTFPLVDGLALPLAKAAPAGFLTRDVASTRDGTRLYAATSQGVESFLVAAGQPVPVAAVPAGDSPVAVALSIDERFVYAANRGNGTISAFRTSASADLVPIAGQPFSVGLSSEPRALAVSPDGRWLYVVQGALNRLAALSIDPGTGALSAGPTAFTTPEPRDVTVSPDGRHVVTVDGGVNRLTVFRHDPTLGLVQLGSFPVGVSPRAATFDATGALVGVVTFFGDTLELYAFDALTGALTPFAAAPLGAGAGPVDVANAPRWLELAP